MVTKYLALLITVMMLCSSVSGQSFDNPTMVFLGASNTNTVQWNNGSYVTKLQDIHPVWKALNITNSGVDGVGAFTYYNQSELLASRLLDYNADSIFIMLGGNDVLKLDSVDEFKTHFHWVLSEISNNTKNIPIFVANIIWSPLENFLPKDFIQRYEEFQNMIKSQVTNFNYYFVDVFNVTEGHPEYYQNDFIHLNEEGHRKVAQAINNQTLDVVQAELIPNIGSQNLGLYIGFGIIAVVVASTAIYFLIQKNRGLT